MWGILDRNRYDGNICNIEGNTSKSANHTYHLFFFAAVCLRNFTCNQMYQPLLVLVIAVNIEFLTEFGDLPLLRSDLSAIRNIDPYLATLQNGYIMNITEYQKGMHT